MAHFSMGNRFNTYSKPTSPPRGRSRVGKKPKRIRTAFSDAQLLALEARYREQKYLNKEERGGMAVAFGLGDKQIKIWFQNRRMKEKKEKLDASTSSPLSADSSVFPESPEIDFLKVAPADRQQKRFPLPARGSQQVAPEFKTEEFPDLADDQGFPMILESEYLLPEHLQQYPARTCAPEHQWQWNPAPYNPYYDGRFQQHLENFAYQQSNFEAANYGYAGFPHTNYGFDSVNCAMY